MVPQQEEADDFYLCRKRGRSSHPLPSILRFLLLLLYTYSRRSCFKPSSRCSGRRSVAFNVVLLQGHNVTQVKPSPELPAFLRQRELTAQYIRVPSGVLAFCWLLILVLYAGPAFVSRCRIVFEHVSLPTVWTLNTSEQQELWGALQHIAQRETVARHSV